MPIQILTTYAPRNGHAEEGRNQKWEEVNEIMDKTCKRHMVTCCTDANGQLVREDEEEKKNDKGAAKHNIIGLYRNQRRTKKGMGRNYNEYAKTKRDTDENQEEAKTFKNDTWEIPKQRKYDKGTMWGLRENTSPHGPARVGKYDDKSTALRPIRNTGTQKEHHSETQTGTKI